MALHAQPSQVTSNVIAASNIGRIDKAADEDDMHVVTSGEAKLEFNERGDRYEVEQTLLDVSGSVIGAVGVVFPHKKGRDTLALQKQAAQVLDEIPRLTSNVGKTLLDASLEAHRAGAMDEQAPKIPSGNALFDYARTS